MSFPQISSLSLQSILPAFSSSNIPQLDPVDQISDDYGIPEIKDVFHKILAKGDSFQNAHHCTMIHDFAKASAYKMREYLQQLKGLGKTPEEICKAGRSFLAVIEESSFRMIKDFEAHQASSIRLETAYAHFDANVASSTDIFTSSCPVFSLTQGSDSLFPSMIAQYRINSTTEQPSVLESVAAKVEKLGNRTAGNPVGDITLSTTVAKQEFLEKLDEMADVEQIKFLVEVVTFIPTAIMEVGIVGVEVACSVPVAKETCSSVKNGALEIARYAAEQIPQGVKDSATNFVKSRQELIAKEIADNIKLGISSENTERYHANLIEGSVGMIPFVGGRLKKMIPKSPAAIASNAIKKKPGPHHKGKVKEHQEVSETSSTNGAPDYFLNRVIENRTRMVPEDIGISRKEFYKHRKLFTHHDHHFEGWMTKKKHGVFKMVIEDIDVPEGRLGNWLTVMSNFKKIALANEARVLQWEAQIVNDKLFKVMLKRFGKPSIIEKQRGHMPVEFHVFKIKLESNTSRSDKATKVLKDNGKGTSKAPDTQTKTTNTTKASETLKIQSVEKGLSAVIWGGKAAKGTLLVHQRNIRPDREPERMDLPERMDPKELDYWNENAHESRDNKDGEVPDWLKVMRVAAIVAQAQ